MQIRPLAREFVLVRLTRMRGVDLDLFDFDYDLTWMAFFLDADARVLGRYGGRDAGEPDDRSSGAGLVPAGGRPIGSFADVQYAFPRAPGGGRLGLAWHRGGKTVRGELALAEGWRKTDVSWRWSLRGLAPPPWVSGADLSAREKR